MGLLVARSFNRALLNLSARNKRNKKFGIRMITSQIRTLKEYHRCIYYVRFPIVTNNNIHEYNVPDASTSSLIGLKLSKRH